MKKGYSRLHWWKGVVLGMRPHLSIFFHFHAILWGKIGQSNTNISSPPLQMAPPSVENPGSAAGLVLTNFLRRFFDNVRMPVFGFSDI